MGLYTNTLVSSMYIGLNSERGVYGLTQIFTPLSAYHLVVVYAHLVDA